MKLLKCHVLPMLWQILYLKAAGLKQRLHSRSGLSHARESRLHQNSTVWQSWPGKAWTFSKMGLAVFFSNLTQEKHCIVTVGLSPTILHWKCSILTFLVIENTPERNNFYIYVDTYWLYMAAQTTSYKDPVVSLCVG